MYGPFLEKQGKEHVAVTPWEPETAAGEWCGEAYEEHRVVTFSFMKQTIGQTKVEVTHTQRRRREGDDRRVVQIRMEMIGVWRFFQSDRAGEALCVHILSHNMYVQIYIYIYIYTSIYVFMCSSI